MEGRRKPIVVGEGVTILVIDAILIMIAWHQFSPLAALPFAILFVLLVMLFRDPGREIPAEPLGVICPVDGTVLETSPVSSSVIPGAAQKVVVRVNHLGTYTARSPIEGKVMELHRADAGGLHGLWVLGDEGHNVVLLFRRSWLGFTPRALVRYGERVGQGQRCAHLRLAKAAEIHLPVESRLLVEPGQKVRAGTDLLAKLAPR